MPAHNPSPTLIQPDAPTPGWAEIDAERGRLAAETEAIERRGIAERDATGSISEATLAAYEANQRAWQAMAGRRSTSP